jgi:ferredoxin-type protein NapH
MAKNRKSKIIKSIVWIMLPITITIGWFYPVIGFVVLFCMLSGITIAFYKGRHWCGWLCPRGSFLDKFVAPLSLKKFKAEPFQNNILKITVLVFLMSMMVLQIYRAWPNVNTMGTVMVTLLSATTLLALILGTFVGHRSWCMICPVGTISSWVASSRNKKTGSKQH